MKVTLERVVVVDGERRYVKVDLERRGRRPASFYEGPFYLRFGGKSRKAVGSEFKQACEVLAAEQAKADAVEQGVEVKHDGDRSRVRIADAIKKFLTQKSLFKGERTVKAYTRRLAVFQEWCDEAGIKFVDQIKEEDDLMPCVSFLRGQKTPQHTLWSARTVHNCFETINTFLKHSRIHVGGKILMELDYEEKEVKPYTPQELNGLFAHGNEEEKLWMAYFLNTGCREGEVAHAEYCDLLDDVNVVLVRSKSHRGFKLKGKRWQNKGRKLPIPTALMDKLRDRMVAKGAKPGDLIFPNGEGNPEGHFLRKLRIIAERACVADAELHRFRKTYADTLAEEGKSVTTVMNRLGHCSLDVTIAYLRGKDAENEEEQESANKSLLVAYV